MNDTVVLAGTVTAVKPLLTVSAIDTSVPGVAVIVVLAVNDPEVAVMVTVQVLVMLAEAVTNPVLLTVAQVVSEELQLTLPVKSFVLPSS